MTMVIVCRPDLRLEILWFGTECQILVEKLYMSIETVGFMFRSSLYVYIFVNNYCMCSFSFR